MNIDRLFHWVETHLPEMTGSFNGPATLDAINAVEAKTGVVFPAELRALYLRFNGQWGGDSVFNTKYPRTEHFLDSVKVLFK